MRKTKSLPMLCPDCGNPVRLGIKPFSYHGALLGRFEVHECPKCGEYSFTPKGSRAIEKAAKERGLFGAGPPTAYHSAVVHEKARA